MCLCIGMCVCQGTGFSAGSLNTWSIKDSNTALTQSCSSKIQVIRRRFYAKRFTVIHFTYRWSRESNPTSGIASAMLCLLSYRRPRTQALIISYPLKKLYSVNLWRWLGMGSSHVRSECVWLHPKWHPIPLGVLVRNRTLHREPFRMKPECVYQYLTADFQTWRHNVWTCRVFSQIHIHPSIQLCLICLFSLLYLFLYNRVYLSLQLSLLLESFSVKVSLL